MNILQNIEKRYSQNRQGKKNIIIRYYLHVCSKGYGVSAEAYICSLWLQGYDIEAVSINGNEPFVGEGIRENILYLCYFKKLEREHDVVIIHDLPQRWSNVIEKERGKKIYGFLLWETERLPQKWVEYISQVDDLLVCCQWNKEVILKDLKNAKIHVLHQALENIKPKKVDEDWAIVEKKLGNKFVFYFIGEWCERKGIEDVIQAFNELNVDAILYIKTFMFPSVVAPKDFEILLDKFRSNKIMINAEAVTSDFIHALHQRGNAYVSAAKGEGIGLGAAEAYYSNNPVVCCMYGGHKDYVETSYPVDFDIVPCNCCSSCHKCKTGKCEVYTWYDKSQDWCKPRMSSLKDQMLKVFKDNKKTNYPKRFGLLKTGEDFAKVLGNEIKLDEVEIVNTKHYGKMHLFKHDIAICRWIKIDYIWEEFLVQRFKEYYRSGNVLDVGAYIGLHTLQFARNCNGTVYAFEAHPTTFKLLTENTKNEKNVQIFNMIVSENDQQRFIDNFKDGESNFGGLSSFETGTIKMKTGSIDAMNLKNITLAKIDVEGHEVSVILGMKKLLIEQRPILFVEICGGTDGNNCSKEDKIEINKRCEIIEGFGYRKPEMISPHDYIFLPK